MLYRALETSRTSFGPPPCTALLHGLISNASSRLTGERPQNHEHDSFLARLGRQRDSRLSVHVMAYVGVPTGPPKRSVTEVTAPF
jgi:hypothetical protein